jgi:S1-C subfamily serine protease
MKPPRCRRVPQLLLLLLLLALTHPASAVKVAPFMQPDEDARAAAADQSQKKTQPTPTQNPTQPLTQTPPAPTSPTTSAVPADYDPLALDPGPTPHPRGEWYAFGHRMADEALPSYALLAIPVPEIRQRLTSVLGALGIEADTLKNTDLTLLQQGWDDRLAGRPPALTYPPDQSSSLLPPALRGLHQFQRKKGAPDTGETLADKATEWKKAVVKVRVKLSNGTAHGSGCFIGPGLILTNHHVIEGALEIAVQLEADATILPATLIADQQTPDVALLRVELQDHAILPIGRSADCRELEEVVMIGYPMFAKASATFVKGAISSTNRIYNGNEVLQLDIRSNRGNSGGPVITTDGRIVGVLTYGLGAIDAELNQFILAIKTDFIRPFLEKYASGQYRSEE